MKVGRGYRERHSRTTLISCFIMLVIVVGSGYYIYSYGLSNDDADVVVTNLSVSIEFYNPAENLTGSVRILYLNDTAFVANLLVDADGFIEGDVVHPIGSYKLYYEGLDNAITFGPIEYSVVSQDALLIDRDFVGVQVTIRTL